MKILRLSLIIIFLLNFVISCEAKDMEKIELAIVQLVESKTDVEEKVAVKELSEIIRKTHLQLNLSVFDAKTNDLIPLNKFLDSPLSSIYVELSTNSELYPEKKRWIPRNIQNIYILLQE